MYPQRFTLSPRLLLTAGACALLAACGGGGSNNSNSSSGPTLNVSASSPGLEIGVAVPAATASATATSNATGYAVYTGATSYYLPTGSGGNPDGLQSAIYNSSNGRLDVAVTNSQVPGIYRLAVNAKDNNGNNTGNLFEVLVYPDGQANVSSGYSANLTATTEVTFNNNTTNRYTANVILPPRLNISYPAGEFSASNFQFGIPQSPPSVSSSMTSLAADGITVNNVSVDSSDDLVVNITVNPTLFGTMSDISPAPSSGGFLMQMNVSAFINGENPAPYMEVFYVTPNVAL